MQNADGKNGWEAYVASEKTRLEAHLERLGFVLDTEQPQTIGERRLTRPIGSGRKVVFFGRRISDNRRIVIKTSSEPRGIAELESEVRARAMLERIRFAYQAFFSPAEVLFDKKRGLLITEYIEQDCPFLERSLKEQFSIALQAFKAQEGAHATVYKHRTAIRGVEEMQGKDYYQRVNSYVQELNALFAQDPQLQRRLYPMLDETIVEIKENEETLDRYGGFLTHWDFVPQNFRIRNKRLYLLDHSSIRFGNKYESWARFLNFMTLYNPELAGALVEYVRRNREPEELKSLKLMRLYRLVELIRYYAAWLMNTEENLYELTRARIAFWTNVLDAVLHDREVSMEAIRDYRTKRDALRSDEEKKRQIGLH